MPITVGKKWDKGAIYIGRPSILGNPFPLVVDTPASRVECLAKYREYFMAEVVKDTPLRREVIKLYRRHVAGEHLHLGCYCSPKLCHGDVIKEFIEQQAAQ